MENSEINHMLENHWKSLVKKKIKELVLKNLVNENNTKEKTRNIKFEKFEMSDYLKENRNTKLSKLIFEIRSGTLDIR